MLQTFRQAAYSLETTPLESVFFNVSESAVRCASEAAKGVRLAATTTAAFFTRASPDNIAGLPSLIFAMSEGGAEKLAISGPHRLMEKYLSCVSTFVHKTYPRIELMPDDLETHKGQPLNVLSSLSGPKYKPLQAGKDKSEAGIKIWRFASGFKEKTSIEVNGGVDDTGGGGKKRRRSVEFDSQSPSISSHWQSAIDKNEVDLDEIDEQGSSSDEKSLRYDEVSSYSYVILISGRPKTVPGETSAEHSAILIADFDTTTTFQLQTVKTSLQAFIGSKILPVSISLCLHFHNSEQQKQSEGSNVPSPSKVLTEMLPDARHVYSLNGDDRTRSFITPSPSGARNVYTHFPASMSQTDRLHQLDGEMFRKPSGGIDESELASFSSISENEKYSKGFRPFLLPLQILPVFPVNGVFRKIEADQPGPNGAGLIAISNSVLVSDSTSVPSSSVKKDDAHLTFTFLGTGAAAPSHRRSCSAILLTSPSFLLDCGEGALVKLMDVATEGSNSSESINSLLHKKLLQLEGIFISHMHADHHTGLLTVLKKRIDAIRDSLHVNGKRRLRPLLILGPPALYQVLTCYFLLFRLTEDESMNSFITFISLQETRPGLPICHRLQLESSPDALFWHCSVPHCRQSFGCAISVPKTADSDERIVFLYSGDTRPSVELAHLAREASTGSAGRECKIGPCSLILIHEATFNDDRLDDAKKKRHSTVTEALDVGDSIRKVMEEESSNRKVALSFLGIVLTHFSQRYPSTSSPITSSGKPSAAESDSKSSTISDATDHAAVIMTRTSLGSSAFFAIDMMRLRPRDFEVNESFHKRSQRVRLVVNDNDS